MIGLVKNRTARYVRASPTKVRAIHRHLWTQTTQLYEQLKLIDEGNGTVYDNTTIVHWNELAQGDTHSISECMVILAGGSNFFRAARQHHAQRVARVAATPVGAKGRDVVRLDQHIAFAQQPDQSGDQWIQGKLCLCLLYTSPSPRD